MSEGRAKTDSVKELAKRLGFAAVGISSSAQFDHAEQISVERIGRGLYDGLPWFTNDRARIACRPSARFPWAHSIISLAAPYDHVPAVGREIFEPSRSGSHLAGRVSRYAAREDYHRAVGDRLSPFVAALGEAFPGVATRRYIDTGPLPERAVAVRAGVGFFGKSANVIVPGFGSTVFLAELITSLDLTPDEPLKRHCGNCALCIEACPTGALIAPYTVDNDRCIAYLTIEHRGVIPVALRSRIGDMVFGCDVCQEVCPVNRGNPVLAAAPALALADLLTLDEVTFRACFGGTALKRAGRIALQRNAAIALGNSGDRRTVAVLARALMNGEPLVRGHSAWALGRLGGRGAKMALERASRGEAETQVRQEIECALGELT